MALDDFDRRRHQRFWRGCKTHPAWDELIDEFNARQRHAGAPRDKRARRSVARRAGDCGHSPIVELRARSWRGATAACARKSMSLEEAAALVQRRRHVGIGGSTLSRTPMAMIWALIRAAQEDLSCSRCIISTDGDLLFGSGVSDHIITSWFSQGILWGVSKVMRHHVENRLARASTSGATWRWACAFAPAPWACPSCRSRSMLGSDVMQAAAGEPKEIDCPFTGEKLLLVPALNPDVALIHVQRCDAYGNAQIDGLQFMDIDLAMAANRVILDDRAHRLQRPDPPRAGPDQDSVLLRRRGGRGALSAARRTSATASTSR